jgi:hypothetical protein
MRLLLLGVLAAGAIALAGCDGGSSALPQPSRPGGTASATPPASTTGPTSSPTPGPAATRTPSPAGGARGAVLVHRTGGFAGVDESLSVAADGSWSYGNARRGTQQSGRLTPAQRDSLQRLLAAPQLGGEANQTPSANCADGFLYTISTGSVRVAFADCGGMDEPPTASAIIELLTAATPL